MDPKKNEDRQKVLKAILLAALLVAALAGVRLSPIGEYLTVSKIHLLQDQLAGFGKWAPVIFLLGGALIITLGVPRSVVSILGGMVFGFVWGMLLALIAALLGSTVIYLATKWLGRPLFRQKVGVYLNVVEDHIKTNGTLVVILLRQLPLACIFINVLIGLTSVSAAAFFWGSVIGLLPETIIFALFGSSLRESFVFRVSIAAFLLVLLVLLVRIYYRNSPLAKKLTQKLTKS